ncbi:4Fe-4S binding protein [Burkholderia cenocepacia]|uniref:4Fe-4S binding protein n=1 Tax=Burkholderia cenocepacia TaxID=95486 RepID=UPI00406C52DC
MIELISESRCTACDRCVDVCPTNVFDLVTEGIPIIARPDDCQTCYMCELYCPADALYVHPFSAEHAEVDETQLTQDGSLGAYARALGWKRARAGGTERDETHRLFELGVT